MAGQGENQAKLTPITDKTPVQVSAKAPAFWRHDKQWNVDWIKTYREYAHLFIEALIDKSIINKDEKFTCEDLPLALLIRFASANKLPLKLTIGGNLYQNQPAKQESLYSDFGYSSKGFENMVNSRSGAKDIYTNSNGVAFDSLQPGDLITQFSDGEKVNKQSEPFHAQMVYKRSGNLIQIAQGQATFGFISGITFGRVRGFDEPDPRKEGYIGTSVEYAQYQKIGKQWVYTHDERPDIMRPELINHVSPRIWKFSTFNY